MIPCDARLLFDECLPKPLVAHLEEFVKSRQNQGLIMRHLFDIALSGTYDEVWVPKIKDEEWTVISADGGRTPNKNRGKKLPQLCDEYGITLIILSPAVHNRKSFDKARTIISVWDQILQIATDPSHRGKRYMLEPLNQKNLVGVDLVSVGRLVEKPWRP